MALSEIRPWMSAVSIAVLTLTGFWWFDGSFYLLYGISLFLFLRDTRGYFSTSAPFNLVLAGLLLLELFLYLNSSYPPNTFAQLRRVIYFLLFYLTASRLLSAIPFQKEYLALGFAGFGVLLSSVAVLQFYILELRLYQTGFSRVSDLKMLYSPLGMLLNEWASVSLGLLCIALAGLAAMHRERVVWLSGLACLAILQLSVLLTQSRGVYLALVFFELTALFCFILVRPFSFAKGGRSMAFFLVLSAVLSWPFREPVLTTLAFNKTVVQQRSTQGRIEVLEKGWRMADSHPLLGAGGYNYPLAAEDQPSEREDQGYSSFSNNSFLELLIEKGAVGLLYYGLVLFVFMALVARRLWRHPEHQERLFGMLVLGGVAALMLREVFFSSLFHSDKLLVIVAWLFFLGAPAPEGGPSGALSVRRALWGSVPAGFLLLVAGWSIWQQERHQRAARAVTLAIDAHRSLKTEERDRYLSQAMDLMPGEATLFALDGLLKSQALIGSEELSNLVSGSRQPDPNVLKGESSYREAIRTNPREAAFYFNLGWIYSIGGASPEAARPVFEMAVRKAPVSAHFIAGKGLFHESAGERDSASLFYVRAIRLSPDLTDSPFFVDLERRRPGEGRRMAEQARDQLQEKLKKAYSTILAARAGKLLLATGDTARAKTMLEQVTKELPGANRPWYYLGLIASGEEDTTQAFRYHRKALLTDGSDYLPFMALGDLYFAGRQEAGKAREALYYYQAGLRNWLGQATASYLHARWKYQYAFGVPNDQVVQGLLYYLNPRVDFAEAAGRIGSLYEQMGEAGMAAYYRQLAGRPPLGLSPEDIK